MTRYFLLFNNITIKISINYSEIFILFGKIIIWSFTVMPQKRLPFPEQPFPLDY